ncbi:hypothetical protein BP6252_11970 [Coleophoma cylindrospora]|uniref:HIT domain-containing protein n=1 Tax=Coleophoma cylindrospora TaxID=1849047 RepID=A0A3D8QFT4_9HELO|nr:hypothetical protein BP6252_11970 [Coleophoma cylindrospora]
MVFSYRAFFGGAREGGCLFCPERRSELKTIVYEDDDILVVKNRGLAGAEHWLVIPHRHIRDIESLDPTDLPLRK